MGASSWPVAGSASGRADGYQTERSFLKRRRSARVALGREGSVRLTDLQRWEGPQSHGWIAGRRPGFRESGGTSETVAPLGGRPPPLHVWLHGYPRRAAKRAERAGLGGRVERSRADLASEVRAKQIAQAKKTGEGFDPRSPSEAGKRGCSPSQECQRPHDGSLRRRRIDTHEDDSQLNGYRSKIHTIHERLADTCSG